MSDNDRTELVIDVPETVQVIRRFGGSTGTDTVILAGPEPVVEQMMMLALARQTGDALLAELTFDDLRCALNTIGELVAGGRDLEPDRILSAYQVQVTDRLAAIWGNLHDDEQDTGDDPVDASLLRRVADDRRVPAGHVTYSEGGGYRWLLDTDGGRAPSVAQLLDIDAQWPQGDYSERLSAVLGLATMAVEGSPAHEIPAAIVTCPSSVAKVEVQLVCDHLLTVDGFRVLVTTATGLTLTGPEIGPSGATGDDTGMEAALNVLWQVARSVSEPMLALDKHTNLP